MEKIKVIKVLNEEHGKEVIKYLESIGGKNECNYEGKNINYYYGIKNGILYSYHYSRLNSTHFEIIELPKKHPERGTKVLVWDENYSNKKEYIFITYIEGAIYPVIVVDSNDEDIFISKEKKFRKLSYANYELIPEPKITEISLKEIAEKFNIPIEQLRIKE